MLNKMNFDTALLKNKTSKLKELESKANNKKDEELYKVALDFEAIFIKQMLNSMKSALNKDNDLLNGGQTEEIFDDMLYDQRAMQVAKSKSFGLADIIYSQFYEIKGFKK